MSSSPNRLKLLLKRSPVVVIYLLFLFVQVFFNFDTGKQQYRGTVIAKEGIVLNQTAQKQFKADAGRSLNTKSRLNKRFQPAAAPVIYPCIVTPVISYAEILTLGSRVDAEYLSSFFTVHSLRGPPAGAICA